MNRGFWDRLPKPFLVLAPMADVTDAAFRRVIAKYGKPDVMWTEFVSADGLVRAPEIGKKKLLADLIYSEEERPIVAQFFTGNPDHMEKTAELARELGFDGIDLNMGCPDKSIEKQKAGAAMMRDPMRAKAVVEAAIRGGGGLPVSVKTRIGYNKNELEEWLPYLLETDVSAITIHARTRKEMSKVPARWEHVQEAVQMRNELQGTVWQKQNPHNHPTLIFGNGDVHTLQDAYTRAKETGADGVMLGRAIFGNPWLFNPEVIREKLDVSELLRVMCEHTRLFEEVLPFKNFALMKKHYKAYVHNFDGAKELRAELMEQSTADEIQEVVNRWLAEQVR